MMRQWFTTGCMWVAVSAVAIAQVPAASGTSARYLDPIAGLTLEDAIARALAHEPGLAAARTDVDVAQGQRIQAALRPNPSVQFAQQQQPGGTDSQTRVEVEWPLDLARRSARIDAATKGVVASRLGVAVRGRELAGLVRQKYGNAASALQRLAIADSALAIGLDQQRLVTARVDQGAAPAVERAVVDVDVQQLRAARFMEVGEVERALVDLKRLLGLAPDATLALRAPLDLLVRQMESETTPSTAQRPDVDEAQAAVAVADAEIARVRAESRPDLSVTGMYMRMDAGFPQQGFTARGSLEPVRGIFHYVSAGASVTVPLFNRNQGSLVAAEAVRVKAAAALEATRATAAAEIASARIRDQQARAAIEVLEGARAQARQTVTVYQQSYQLGRATLLDVLEQQRRYIEFERQYGAALAEAFAARQDLLQASGGVQ